MSKQIIYPMLSTKESVVAAYNYLRSKRGSCLETEEFEMILSTCDKNREVISYIEIMAVRIEREFDFNKRTDLALIHAKRN